MRCIGQICANKYLLIADELGEEIRAGRYAVRNSFPSLTQIMRRFGVSRPTAMRSVAELKRSGLLNASPRSSMYVSKTATSRKIGLIVPGIAVTDFFKPIVSEINRLAHEANYELRFGEVWSEIREERTTQVRALAEEFCDGNFAGVIYEPMAGPLGDEINPVVLGMFDRKKIPVVLLDCDIVPFPQRSGYDVVGVNDLEAGARIANHLLDVGAKNIHFLICKLCPITFTNRLAGAEAALNIAGAKAPKGGNVLYAEADDLNALKRYLKRQKSCPDAFICSNDAIAAVFRQTLEAAGLDVPQDVMLTGFADLQIASLMSPKLTTVHQNREMMAHMAFKRLMDRINDPSLPPCDFFLPSNLVARESTLSSKNFKRRKS
ncbi:MAG: LacI family DNA-binding transcriptional regulator [Kiritimatiellae bacterium]|nr:LacI family DNA-binding transcriptional regulator [Kiritimatiellia bacterium]